MPPNITNIINDLYPSTTQSKLTTTYNIRMRQGAKARIIHYQQPQKQQVQAPKTYRKGPHIPENHHYQLKI